MEKEILNIIEFDLYAPTSITFLKVYNEILHLDERVKVTAFYLADLMLLASNTHMFRPSILASSYLFLSLITHHKEIPQDERLQKARQIYCSWYTEAELEECVDQIRLSWHDSR